jgi:tRNA-guanine family transglycosylase
VWPCLSSRVSYIDDARVHGVYVSGLGTGESASERLEVLKTVAERVPRQKLRMVSGVSNPMEVLEAIRCGMDMFDTSFVGMVTRAGLALCFPTDSASCVEKAEIVGRSSHAETAAQCGLDGMKMNLWSGTYKLDRSPLVHDCPCGTCRDHTRGYVHHLLVTHEMTANVLLEQHNVYHMLRFFTGIRRAIRDGVFETYYQAFVGYVQRWQRCSQ